MLRAGTLFLVILAPVALAGCATDPSEGLVKNEPISIHVVRSKAPEWMLIQVKNEGEKSLTIYPSDFRIVDATGKVKEYSMRDQFHFSSNERLEMTEIHPGEYAEGYIGFGDFSGTAPFTLKYESMRAKGEVQVP